jgi:hypothetical protein
VVNVIHAECKTLSVPLAPLVPFAPLEPLAPAAPVAPVAPAGPAGPFEQLNNATLIARHPTKSNFNFFMLGKI